jgi:hypothetical protein
VSNNDGIRHHFCILIRTISIAILPTMKVNIHNQYSSFQLRYWGNWTSGIVKYRDFVQKVDDGSMTIVDFKSPLTMFEGVLICKLQRKSVESDDQSENFESDDQSESTCILLLVAWKSEDYKNFYMFTHLVEHEKQFRWSLAKLEEYCQRYANQLCIYSDPIKDTWLTRDGTVLMTESELDFAQRDGILNITIAEGVKDNFTKIPKWIDSER